MQITAYNSLMRKYYASYPAVAAITFLHSSKVILMKSIRVTAALITITCITCLPINTKITHQIYYKYISTQYAQC